MNNCCQTKLIGPALLFLLAVTVVTASVAPIDQFIAWFIVQLNVVNLNK